MTYYICEINTNIHFQHREHYIEFEGNRIKFVSNLKKADDLILEMKSGMDHESAHFFVTRFISILSFSYDQIFDIRPGFTQKLPGIKSFRDLKMSSADKRTIAINKSFKNFPDIYSFDGRHKIDSVRLYRLSKIAKPIYSQILLSWHSLCHASNEGEARKFLDRIDNNNVKNILRNPLLYKGDNKEKITFGEYIYTCVRHAIAHIERDQTASGRSIVIDSRKDEKHLYKVGAELIKATRKKILNDYNLPEIPNVQVSLFNPDNGL